MLSATSGKAGGLTEVERLKAEWPFGRPFARPSNILPGLSPRTASASTHHTDSLSSRQPAPLLSLVRRTPRAPGTKETHPHTRATPGTVELYESSCRAGGLPVELMRLHYSLSAQR